MSYNPISLDDYIKTLPESEQTTIAARVEGLLVEQAILQQFHTLQMHAFCIRHDAVLSVKQWPNGWCASIQIWKYLNDCVGG